MLNFLVDEAKCIRCELCVTDCPVRIISMDDSVPFIEEEKEEKCMRCQHCLAICPEGAISILNRVPENSVELDRESRNLETLVRGRRSIRHFQNKDLTKSELVELVNIAAHSPTGKNDHGVSFTLTSGFESTDKLRKSLYEELHKKVLNSSLPEEFSFFEGIVKAWQKGHDVIFRNAPHLLVTSAPTSCATPLPDCLLAMSTFELLAASKGIGTLWNGFAMWAFELAPETRTLLEIPENHQIGYMMVFGYPQISYQRTVQREASRIHILG